MKDGIEIRRMEAGDIGAVAAIEADSFSIPWTPNGFKTALDRRDTIFFVAERKGEILGYVGFYISIDEADITNIAVAKTERRQGIGRSLMENVKSVCEKKGVRMIGLEVRAGNEPAKELYSGMGFKEVGVRKDFYRCPTEDACVMIWFKEDE